MFLAVPGKHLSCGRLQLTFGNMCPIELPQTSASPGRSDLRILELCLGWWRKQEGGDLSLTSCSGFTDPELAFTVQPFLNKDHAHYPNSPDQWPPLCARMVCRNVCYGHPSSETLHLLQDRQAVIYTPKLCSAAKCSKAHLMTFSEEIIAQGKYSLSSKLVTELKMVAEANNQVSCFVLLGIYVGLTT